MAPRSDNGRNRLHGNRHFRPRRSRARAQALLVNNGSSGQEGIPVDLRLFEDGSHRAFGHVTGVVWYGRVSVRTWIEPDLVAPCRLAIKYEPAGLQLSGDVTVFDPASPPI